MAQQPLLIVKNRTSRLNEANHRETQISNLLSASKLLPIIRTSLGPRAHLKMLLNPIGGVTITSDGFAIVRDLFPDHPIANLVVQGSRAQDEEVGDGTTSCVIISAGLLEQLIHIVQKVGIQSSYICKSLSFAKNYILQSLKEFSHEIDLSDTSKALYQLVENTISTKQSGKLKDLICKLTVESIKILAGPNFQDCHKMSIKKDLRMLQILGESELETSLIEGVVLEKDVLHPSMKRSITNPRILIISGSLEYKKGESQTTITIEDQSKFDEFLIHEEQEIKQKVQRIINVKPDIVLIEGASCELANFLLMQAGISALRRCKAADLHRLAQACHANIRHIDDIDDSISQDDLGLSCSQFEVKKIAKEYFSFFYGCRNARAATLVIRGPVKDVLADLCRTFQDSTEICRTVLQCPKLVPGAGAIELLLSTKIQKDLDESDKICGPLDREIMRCLQNTIEMIPQILLENAGIENVARKMLQIKSLIKKDPSKSFGIDGMSGEIISSNSLRIWDPFKVKYQIYKTALDTARMVINIDEIVSITSKKQGPKILQ